MPVDLIQSKALMSVGEVMGRWRTMQSELVGHPDNHYAMFRKEDASAWVCFTVTFTVLIIFDNFILNRKHERIGMLRAAVQTVFWMLCAGAFAIYVYYRNGHNAAFDWSSGYMLEWMLSFDNLFVFHMIFQIYQTPDHLKHKPLFWGICGAVFFRLVFIFIGEYLMHAMWAAHLFFGAFLVWTGVTSAMADDEDEDPTQNTLVQWLSQKVAFIPIYDKAGSFFVNVPCDKDGNVLLSMDDNLNQNKSGSETASTATGSESESGESESEYGTVQMPTREYSSSVLEAGRANGAFDHYERRATMLFLVVCCLEISDILFAVDSVSAIVAQISDLFLAYTSAVFAMLGLRSTFFIIDVLVKIFSLLKYGVAAVLVFIGIKLIISKVYHIPPMLVCVILFGTLGGSMVASVIGNKMGWLEDDNEDKESEAGSETEKAEDADVVSEKASLVEKKEKSEAKV